MERWLLLWSRRRLARPREAPPRARSGLGGRTAGPYTPRSVAWRRLKTTRIKFHQTARSDRRVWGNIFLGDIYCRSLLRRPPFATSSALVAARLSTWAANCRHLTSARRTYRSHQRYRTLVARDSTAGTRLHRGDQIPPPPTRIHRRDENPPPPTSFHIPGRDSTAPDENPPAIPPPPTRFHRPQRESDAGRRIHRP